MIGLLLLGCVGRLDAESYQEERDRLLCQQAQACAQFAPFETDWDDLDECPVDAIPCAPDPPPDPSCELDRDAAASCLLAIADDRWGCVSEGAWSCPIALPSLCDGVWECTGG